MTFEIRSQEKHNNRIFLLERWIPAELYHHPPLYRRARLSALLALITGALGVIYAPLLVLVIQTSIFFGIILIAGALQTWMSLWLLRKTASIYAVGHNLALGYFWCISAMAILSGGLDTGVTFWLALSPLIATLLCGARAGVVWMSIIVGEVLILSFLHLGGISFPQWYAEGRRLWWTILGTPGFMIIVTCFMRAAVVAQNNALLEAHCAQQRLKELNEQLESRITERTTELRASLERENQLNVFRTAFVADASHEFRTPLTVIQLNIEMLERYTGKMDTQQQKDRVSRITEEIRHITHILDRLLEIESVTPETVQLLRRDFLPSAHRSELTINGSAVS